jgi:AcrR family transcriptional regulator
MDAELPLDHANTQHILREGWALFQQKGFRGVTVDELCRRCGLTKPTLYYYFHDKENLFVQILRYQLRDFHTVIEQPGTLRERLQRIAASILVNFQTDHNALLRDREHIKDPANLQRIRDTFHSELLGPMRALMQEGIAQGELVAEDPEFLTLAFFGLIGSFVGRADDWRMDRTALAQRLVTYFLHGARQA